VLFSAFRRLAAICASDAMEIPAIMYLTNPN
jgi:hypothetical protein